MMTPRIRSVKPELFSHEGLFEIEMQYQLPLRLAYIALFTCCDRDGRFRWQPRRLKLDMLPYDTIDMGQVLEIFLEHGYIQKYEDEGKYYGCIPSWHCHQIINGKEAESKIPAIKIDHVTNNIHLNLNNTKPLEENSVIDVSFTREARVDNVSNSRSLHVNHGKVGCLRGSEGIRRERKRIGREGEGDLIVAPKTRPSSDEAQQQIENIFEHWKVLMDHPNAKLDEKRKSIIRKALKFGYSVSDLCQAIAGCSYTPHNMGDNDRGQRFDGLHVILRDADQIDRFIHNCKYPPRRQTDADRRSQANVETLKNWVKKTMGEEVANGTA